MEEEVKGVGDYLSIIWRRKAWVIIPAIILSVISISVVWWLPATYKSKGTILIESQEIPHDLIKSTVTSYADQRIEVIKRRLMTTNRIMKMVNKYHLYAKEQKKAPGSSVIVDLFRSNTKVELVQAEVIDPISGRSKRASIAFTVSFMDKSPAIAQQVANELVTEFLNENVKTRTSRAKDTKVFLREEADKFQKKVQQVEKKIADFKDHYSKSLPELLQYNLTLIQNLQEEIGSNQTEILTLKDQITTMSIELPSISPYQSGLNSSEQPGSSEALLEKLRVEYNSLLGKYEPNHPDVVRLKKQIQGLEKELGISNSAAEQLQTELAAAKTELSGLKQRYGDNHPDIKALKKKIKNLQTQLANVKKSSVSGQKTVSKRPSNPAYIQLKSKIDSAEREVARLGGRQQQARAKLADYEQRVTQTHQVARAYEELTRDHANTLAKYKELRAKQLEAELAQNLESENKGESFSLIEPPLVPTEAEKPNRPKLMVIGVVLSIGLGMGLALIIEMLFGGVRGYKQIGQVVGKAPLVVIPVIKTAQEVARKKTTRNRWLLLVLLLMVVSVVIVHFYVINLEVLWFKVMRKVSLL